MTTILTENLKQEKKKKIKPNHQPPVTFSHPNSSAPGPLCSSHTGVLVVHQRARHTPTSGALRCCLFCLNVLPSLTTSSLLMPPAPLGLHQNCHLTQDRDYSLIFHCFRTRFLSFKNSKFINQNFTSNNGLQISKYNKHLNIISS